MNALLGIVDKSISGVKCTIASGYGKKLMDYVSEIVEITGASTRLDGIGKKGYGL